MFFTKNFNKWTLSFFQGLWTNLRKMVKAKSSNIPNSNTRSISNCNQTPKKLSKKQILKKQTENQMNYRKRKKRSRLFDLPPGSVHVAVRSSKRRFGRRRETKRIQRCDRKKKNPQKMNQKTEPFLFSRNSSKGKP